MTDTPGAHGRREWDEVVVLDNLEILVNSDIHGRPAATATAWGMSVIGEAGVR